MSVSRRGLMEGLGTLSVAAGLGGPLSTSPANARTAGFPYKGLFEFSGRYLNAAYVHPMSVRAREAGQEWLRKRATEATHRWPRPDENSRENAKAKFAKLINAAPADIAVVPSTLSGENLVAETLRAGNGGRGFGVVTDPFHYQDSLVLYSELYSDPIPVRVVKPRGNRIDLADIEALIDADVKLVAVSMVASANGFYHDMKALCDTVHKKGAMVYADIIQAAGAVPFDVQETGVDFCCAGSYKWLMGDFGPAFLYVRPDRLKLLKRVQLGWYGIPAHTLHILPGDPPGRPEGEWRLGTDTASIFEVSTPAFGPLAIDDAALDLLLDIGVENIARWRQPLIDRLQDAMPEIGLPLITPKGTRGPIAAFSYKAALKELGPVLEEAKIRVTLYENTIRVSPSIYNDINDIDYLLDVLRSHVKSR
jgi:selenocysteine lyase/cysteine desulfurase